MSEGFYLEKNNDGEFEKTDEFAICSQCEKEMRKDEYGIKIKINKNLCKIGEKGVIGPVEITQDTFYVCKKCSLNVLEIIFQNQDILEKLRNDKDTIEEIKNQ